MKKNRILSIFILLIATSALPAHAGDDLPAQGRSTFDHFIQKVGGDIPYPFDKLVQKMKEHGPGEVVGAFIPEGRSLQRFQTDFANPRVVVSGGGFESPSADGLHSLKLGNVFVGFSPKANTLEVISFNETLGRHEFQLVKNYGPGLKPELEYAPRALCVSCHQNEAPIFTRGPWLETNNNHSIREKLEAANYKIYGVEGSFMHEGLSVGQFDNAIDENGQFDAFKKLWSELCKGPTAVECRKAFVKSQILNRWGMVGFFDGFKQSKTDKIRDQFLEKQWPVAGIEMHDRHIGQRDPEEHPISEPLPATLDPLTTREPVLLKDAGHDFRRFMQHAEEFYLPALQVKEIRDLSKNQYKKVEQILDGPEFTEMFSRASPPSRMDFIERIKTGLTGKSVVGEYVAAEARMPAMKLAVNTLSGENLSTKIGHFKKNCMQCHVGQSEPRMNFMSASNDEELWQNLTQNPEVLKRLDYANTPDSMRMPPPSSKLGKSLRGENAHEQTEMFSSLSSSIAESCSMGELLKRTIEAP